GTLKTGLDGTREDRGAARLSLAADGRPRGGCFFFQAEDGIRDLIVTGVQTCALPISGLVLGPVAMVARKLPGLHTQAGEAYHWRSEERRVGKEWRHRWWAGS